MNLRVEGVGVTKATPNTGCTPVASGWIRGEDGLGDQVARHKVTTMSSSSVRRGTIHVPKNGMTGHYRGGKARLGGISLF